MPCGICDCSTDITHTHSQPRPPRRCRLFYVLSGGSDENSRCGAAIEIAADEIVYAYGASWAEAREKVIAMAKDIPEEEWVEI